MAKKPTVTLRKPPAPATLEAFVEGKSPAPSGRGSATQAAKRPATQAARNPAPQAGPTSTGGKGVLERSGGRLTRRMTMYLELELARRLVRHCAEHEREISEVAAEALAAYLDAR